MVTRLRAGRLENRGSIPDRKDDLSFFLQQRAVPWLRSGSLCDTCGEQSGTATGFSPVLPLPPVSIIPPTLHSHLYLHAALPEGQTGEAWEKCRRSEGMKQNGTFTEMSKDLRRWRNTRRAFPWRVSSSMSFCWQWEVLNAREELKLRTYLAGLHT